MLTVRIPNLVQVQQGMQALAMQATQQRPALEAARDEVEQIYEEKFAAEGPGWAPLKPVTVAKRGTSNPILYETGRLADSYQRGGPQHIEWWSPVSVEVGSALRQAAPHEDGFANRGVIPAFDGNPPIRMRGQRVAARPLLSINPGAMDNRIADAYAQALFEALGI